MEKLCNIRKQQRLSQKILAELSNLSRSTIINFEKDKRDPRVRDLKKNRCRLKSKNGKTDLAFDAQVRRGAIKEAATEI